MNKVVKRAISLSALCLVLLFGFGRAAQAQTLYGSIVGLVEDTSNSAVPNAKIVATNPATGVNYEATSDDSGSFTISNVQPGAYDLKLTLQGFKTQSRTGVIVSPNVVSRSNFRLEVGSLSEQITVAADAVQLQADKSDTHSEIGSNLVKSAPLPGYRNYQTLINLVPGANPGVFQNSATDTPQRSLRTNINGANANNNVTRIDGAAAINLWLPHHAGYVTPAEMVETVNITTTAGDAEQGFAGGAAVTVVTKSGTNQFHGSGFWYHDNQRLRARNFFFTPTTRKPVSIYNNFGGTIGGPIVKNKLFFFYSYDDTKERRGLFGVFNVPQADLRTGDFSRVASITTIYDPATSTVRENRTPFPGNRIPPSRFSPAAQKIAQFHPLPNIANADLNNYAVGQTPLFNRRYNDFKINYNRNEKHMIWGRYGIMNALVGGRGVFGDGVGPVPTGTDAGLGDTQVQNTVVGHTYTIAPNLLLDGVFGFNRQDQVVRGQDFGRDFSSQLGIPGIGGSDPRQQGFPNISFTGYNGFGVPNWMPLERIEESFTTSHNLRWIKSSHTVAMGVDGILMRMNHWQPELGAGPRGAFQFTNGVTSNSGTFNHFNSYAQFLLGATNNIQKSLQNILATTREWQFGLYVQDRWQMHRNFTLNYGVRYEYYPLMGRAAGKGIERLDPATNTVFLGGRGNVPRNNGFTVSKMNFAPRVGFAWRFNEKTVLRSGYGINFSPLPWSRPLRGFYPLTVNFAFDAPDANSQALVNGQVRTLDQGIPPVTGPDLSSGAVPLPNVADMRSPYAGEISRGYTQSWNFTLERRLPTDIIGSIAYVGTGSRNMMGDRDINSGQVLGLGNPGRPYSPLFGRNISTLMWDGYLSANYHSLQTSVQKQGKNVTLKGAYTWAHAINYADDEGWQGVSYNWGPAFERNRASAGYDRRHVFQLFYSYDLPAGKGKKFLNSGLASQVLGGWNIAGTTSMFTGTPLNLSSPAGSLNLPGNIQTPDQVKLSVDRPEKIGTDGAFYDTTAFAAVSGGTPRFGTLGRNVVRNPGANRTDLVLSKNFAIGERVNAMIRAESYNFTNSRLSTGFATGDVTNTNFLRVTSATDERQFRLGLRLSF